MTKFSLKALGLAVLLLGTHPASSHTSVGCGCDRSCDDFSCPDGSACTCLCEPGSSHGHLGCVALDSRRRGLGIIVDE